jgi:hypothetical protein
LFLNCNGLKEDMTDAVRRGVRTALLASWMKRESKKGNMFFLF